MKQSDHGVTGSRPGTGRGAGRRSRSESSQFSGGLALGVSAFLLSADNQNIGAHADLSQAFLCGLTLIIRDDNLMQGMLSVRNAACEKLFRGLSGCAPWAS